MQENRDNLKESEEKRKKIIFFGHFGTLNFGNESTFEAILYHLRRFLADVEVGCVCSGPEALAAAHSIEAVAISSMVVKPSRLRNPVVRFLRKVFVGIPVELYRWLEVFKTLKGTDTFMVPGTGLLTDAYGLSRWGPYNLFKWTAIAKLRGCKVLFVSVGAGPIYGVLGRWLVRSALALADFRSYRDRSSLEWVKQIGLRVSCDRIYPDLVFSLPETKIPRATRKNGDRCVVGIGLMEYAGRYSVPNPSDETYPSYLETLVLFVKWLVAHEYNVRLLMADDQDWLTAREFKSLLKTRVPGLDEHRIADDPAECVGQLLSQLAATDLVVATRFHNILFALLLEKPVISISFHHKCSSLMREMGLSEYCHDINELSGHGLIESFHALENDAEKLKLTIRTKVRGSRMALDEQYNLIFNGILGGR